MLLRLLLYIIILYVIYIHKRIRRRKQEISNIAWNLFEKEHVRYNLSFNIYHLALRRYYQLRKL